MKELTDGEVMNELRRQGKGHQAAKMERALQHTEAAIARVRGLERLHAGITTEELMEAGRDDEAVREELLHRVLERLGAEETGTVFERIGGLTREDFAAASDVLERLGNAYGEVSAAVEQLEKVHAEGLTSIEGGAP